MFCKKLFEINKIINEQKKGNSFLGKKKKIFFKIKKDRKKNKFFINKSIKQIKQLEKTLPKKEKSKLFYTNNYNFFKEENKNEGRWSYDEHIKFIKAYVNFGKNYLLCQKYIGSRNHIQIISHAQKFFKKLKKLKNQDFDFTNDNIKYLSDIFKLIEAKNKNNIDKKEFIINTLISLCESNPKNENNYLNKKIKNKDIKRRKKIEDKDDKSIKYPLFHNEKEIKRENYESPKNFNNNEDKMFIFENYEINNDLINSNLDLKKEEINQKESFDLEDMYINKEIDIDENEKKPTKVVFVNEKRNCNNFINVDNNFNQNIKTYGDFIYSAGNSDLFCFDEISSDVNKFLFAENTKTPFINFIANYSN